MNHSFSVCIPSRDRFESIASLINSINLFSNAPSIPILVLNNSVTEGQIKLYNTLSSIYPNVNLINSSSDLSIGQNIVRAILQSDTDYMYLLSDHVMLNTDLKLIFEKVVNYKPDFAVANLIEYSTLFPHQAIFKICDMNPSSFGKLFFCSSNISTLILSRKIINSFREHANEYSNSDYPHLFLYQHCQANSCILVIPGCAYLQNISTIKTYHRFHARFLQYPSIYKSITSINVALNHLKSFVPPLVYLKAAAHQMVASPLNSFPSNVLKFYSYNNLINTLIVLLIVPLLLFKNSLAYAKPLYSFARKA